MNSTVFSEAHRHAGECLKVMMMHNQISVAQGMELFEVSRVALLSYRSGANTIPYKVMMRMIAAMQPSDQMKATFMSAIQLSVLETWRKHGESHASKKRRGELK